MFLHQRQVTKYDILTLQPFVQNSEDRALVGSGLQYWR